MSDSQIEVEAGHARLLILAMEQDFPAKVEEWKENLRVGVVTSEMRAVFTVMGYPVPRAKGQGRRKRAATEASTEAVEQQDSEAVESMHESQPVLLDRLPDDFGAPIQVRRTQGT